MPRINSVELLPPEQSAAELVAQAIEKKVAEALAHGSEADFQPFFQPREVAYEIKRKKTVTEQRVWSEYFKKYGCIVCSPNARSSNYAHAIALDAEKITELRKQGLGWYKIAEQLGVHYSTIRRFRNGDRSRVAGGKRFERPKAPEISNGPGHRALSLCTTCYQRIATRRQGILRQTAPARDHTELTFMDSVRLAREALAPSVMPAEENGRKKMSRRS